MPEMRGIETREPGEWLVGLSSWVIQDGNYVDFEVGQLRRFAVEFRAEDLREAAIPLKAASPLGEGRYHVNSEVVVAHSDLVVLDFGLLAYTDSRAPAARRGEALEGVVFLEVDCYSYFEIHATTVGVPAAVYSWTITGIWRQTAPFIPDKVAAGNVLVRDPERRGWAWLDRTDAWSDDDGRAEYLIRCRLEPDPPMRHP